MATGHSRPGSNPTSVKTFRFGTLAIPFTLLCQCLSDETIKAVGPFYLVSMPGEVKDPTSPHWSVYLSWTPPPTLNRPVCEYATLDAALHNIEKKKNSSNACQFGSPANPPC